MANKKVSELTALGAAPATNDLLPLVDISDTTDAASGTTKKMTVANIFTSPTITTPTIADLSNSNHNHTNAAGGGQLTDAALSAAVSISKGGTGQTSQTAAFDALAPTTTQGDIIYHNGTDNVRLAKGTTGQVLKMNDGATAPEWGATTPFFQQELSVSVNDAVSGAEISAGSNQSGSVLYLLVQTAGLLYRFARDSLTGTYIQTHSVDPTFAVRTNTNAPIIVIGSYIYIFSSDATNIICSRFSADDLTGEQVMTVPTVACTNQANAWTDGTAAYVVSNSSDTTARKWTVSGTTFSASSTATMPSSSTFTEADMSNMFDGTTAYLGRHNSNVFTLYKLTNIDGSTVSTSTKISPTYSDLMEGSFMINIDSTKMYIGFSYPEYDEAAQVATRIHLIPITKP